MAASAAATGEVRSSAQKVRRMPYSPTKERGLDVARNTNPYPVASEYSKKRRIPRRITMMKLPEKKKTL